MATQLNVWPEWGYSRNSDCMPDSPWARKVVLTLDGGGVRGYASLEILKRLMEKIKEIETKENLTLNEGSWSYPWCSKGSKPKEPDESFRLHHYVDYIVGTSTGGLSALMLGRLRMPIKDAQARYNTVGKEVFQKQRSATLGGLRKTKCRDKNFEKVLMRITGGEIDDQSSKKYQTRIENRANEVKLRDPNPAATRTVAVSYGGAPARLTYLFRSYDNTAADLQMYGKDGRPSRKTKANLRYFNNGPASDAPLWKVARATSAAPTWFGPIEIGETKFFDGAVAYMNNPVQAAYDEVKQMHPMYEPKMVISIGTGEKQETSESEPRGGPAALWQKFVDLLELHKRLRKGLSDTETAHAKFEQQNRERALNSHDAAEYVRFNLSADGADSVGNIKLGEWKGEDGVVTKGKIVDAVSEFMEDTEQNMKLLDCAEKLVKIRKDRAKTVRWERFALDTVRYTCPKGNGPMPAIPANGSEPAEDQAEVNRGLLTCHALTFETRLELRQHLIQCHGYVWQVKLMHDRAAVPPIEWTCFWDQCERQAKGFQGPESFVEHCKSSHKIANPRIVTMDEFECELDKGLKFVDAKDTLYRQRTTFSVRQKTRQLSD